MLEAGTADGGFSEDDSIYESGPLLSVPLDLVGLYCEITIVSF